MDRRDLHKKLRTYLDSSYSKFDSKFMEGGGSIAQAWGKVFEEYYTSMYLPIPGKSIPLLKKSIKDFVKELKGILESKLVIYRLELAIQKLHFKVIRGVDSIPIWQTTPPSNPLFLRPCFIKTKGYKGETTDVLKRIADRVDIWVKQTSSYNRAVKATFLWL